MTKHLTHFIKHNFYPEPPSYRRRPVSIASHPPPTKKSRAKNSPLGGGHAVPGWSKKSINWGAGPICIAGKVGIRNAISKPSRPVDGLIPHRHPCGYSTA